MPTHWLNPIPSLPEPLPPVVDDSEDQYRMKLQRRIRLQSMLALDADTNSLIPIPEAVREDLANIGRPTPLTRARALERRLGTPAQIYLKREDTLPTGAFKLNSAMAQVRAAKEEGAERLVTETGAGQWGHAVAFACARLGLHPTIFWAAISARQKASRHALLELLGARVESSPSSVTELGRRVGSDPTMVNGSLGLAIGEAVEYAAGHPETRYISGSNVPHVLIHQSVIGLETKAQLAALGVSPDVLIACVGGGSNLVGFMAPFFDDKAARGDDLRFVAAEAATSPRLTKGRYEYDYSDLGCNTPMVKSYTLGRDYELPPTHVGGLRQHSGSPIVGVVHHADLLEARAYEEKDIFAAGHALLMAEQILIAPESCHALLAGIEEALEAKRAGEARVIVICVSGSGTHDLEGYVEKVIKQ
nr:TrpB-like pyridoxal phosphate-dependent enzyme [Propionibacterium sp. oral taxon 192]